MGIVLDTLTTMAIATDPTASMMLEIEKGTAFNIDFISNNSEI